MIREVALLLDSRLHRNTTEKKQRAKNDKTPLQKVKTETPRAPESDITKSAAKIPPQSLTAWEREIRDLLEGGRKLGPRAMKREQQDPKSRPIATTFVKKEKDEEERGRMEKEKEERVRKEEEKKEEEKKEREKKEREKREREKGEREKKEKEKRENENREKEKEKEKREEENREREKDKEKRDKEKSDNEKRDDEKRLKERREEEKMEKEKKKDVEDGSTMHSKDRNFIKKGADSGEKSIPASNSTEKGHSASRQRSQRKPTSRSGSTGSSSSQSDPKPAHKRRRHMSICNREFAGLIDGVKKSGANNIIRYHFGLVNVYDQTEK